MNSSKMLIMLMIFGLFAFGCLGGQQAAPAAAPTAAPAPAPVRAPTAPPVIAPQPEPVEEMVAAPEFMIDSPTEGGITTAGSVTVMLSVSNFEIVAPGENQEGQGHFHLYLDGGDYIPCASTTCTVSGVTPGQHTIKVDLRNNDHSLYEPENAKTVTFRARAG